MKKLLTLGVALLCGVAAFAQEQDKNALKAQPTQTQLKQEKVFVFDDLATPAQQDNDGRTGNLALEYFKSELATHSGIMLAQTSNLQIENVMEVNGLKRGQKLTAAQIASANKKMGASYCCLVGISRKDSKTLMLTANLYNADGSLKKTLSRPLDNVRQADFAGILLARDVAVAIHGQNPVDDLNLEAMKTHIEKLAAEDTRMQQQMEKNRKALKK